MKKGVILGAFTNDDDKGSYLLTKSASIFDEKNGSRLKKIIDIIGPVKKGKSRVLYDIDSKYDAVSVVGLGPVNAKLNEAEEIDEGRENVRCAVAAGLRSLREATGLAMDIDVDDCNDAEAAAEGVHLARFNFDELKCEKYRKKPVKLNLLGGDDETQAKWRIGEIKANGQNMARRLSEMPANLMTPTAFAVEAEQLAKKYNFEVKVYDKQWAEEKKMGLFLSVAKGSSQPLRFVEMHYNNAPEKKPVVFVGKGICYDSGGYSLKPTNSMHSMRYDMTGAAHVLSTFVTLAALKAKVNIIGLTPLCENLINGEASKPGDVFVAMNGKSVQVDNTDAEGRLILADALCYAHTFQPELIVDIATLTGAMKVALGSSATGVFSTSANYFDMMRKCGMNSGDRVWRMPLFNHFSKQISDTHLADLNNMGKYSGEGGCCIAAAFLKEFVTCENWMHLDIAGTGNNRDEISYLNKGFSGRPLRTLIEFFESTFK